MALRSIIVVRIACENCDAEANGAVKSLSHADRALGRQ